MSTNYDMYLQYVRNAGAKATKDNFTEDWEPTGEMLLCELVNLKMVSVDKKGVIRLLDD